MARAIWLADIIRDTGLKVTPYPGWESRGGDSLDPRGIMLHHTVTRPSTANLVVDRTMAVIGNSSTPPPLCNWSTNRDGSVSIIAAGTANHGGKGSWQGLSGNRYFLADEMKNLGSGNPASVYYEPWSEDQLEAARVVAAAVANHIGMDPEMLCGHKEYGSNPPGWPGRKTDPHTLNMDQERLTLRNLMEMSMGWQWNDGEGSPIDDERDADTVFEFQGTFAPGVRQASYVPGDYKEANKRVWIVMARMAQELMKQGERLRKGGL